MSQGSAGDVREPEPELAAQELPMGSTTNS